MAAKPNPRKTNGHRRRQLTRRVLATETHCALCGKPVDKTLPPGQPESPEVDEIIPVSLGGSPYQRSNCQLAHRLCNQRKGNQLNWAPPDTDTPGDPPPPTPQPRTSRPW